ncbi:helix-turn-helix domain-containing protein [Loigolactobacillus binensis]|uniref:Helix-turn-helix domain-containing protein n=1 Tax=Loigolactobacillus binensis TaxID=2559922 RepID=A0ABW3EE35_9LACO|nr:helix-turn-helix transcriptional regulator [Loigolactobacillus binensis]
MFLAAVMKEMRLRKKLTQFELAQGICNQNVISKMEKTSYPPKFANLIPLLQRLDLTLNDVFSEFTNSVNTEIEQELLTIEHKSLLMKEHASEDQLALLAIDDQNQQIKLQFVFIKARFAIEAQQFDDAFFELDKVLALTKNDNYDIYTILAYLDKAALYTQLEEAEKAAYFYEIVEQALKMNFNIGNADAVQLLYLCQQMGMHYFFKQDALMATKYADYGIKIDEKMDRASFLPEFYLIKTFAATQNKNQQAAKEYQTATMVYARYFKNSKIVELARELLN